MNVLQVNQSYELKKERLSDVPENYTKPLTGVDTASDIDVRAFMAYCSMVIPVWHFQAHGKIVCAKRAVAVIIRKEEDVYCAESENLGIFVVGESQNEAADAFAEQVVHFYEHYRRLGPSDVTGEAQKLQQLYNKWFEEAGL